MAKLPAAAAAAAAPVRRASSGGVWGHLAGLPRTKTRRGLPSAATPQEKNKKK